MSSYAGLVVIVEGDTELKFIKESLSPYLMQKNIFVTPIIANKPGQKGGDVKFERIKNDIRLYLKQRSDTYLTLMIDFYGLKKEWPGRMEACKQTSPAQKAEIINKATKSKIKELLPESRADIRFIPYVSMHEFEALLFSNPEILANSLRINIAKIESILGSCREPENINDSFDTAPSKRLEKLSEHFRKTGSGIVIAKEIGIDRMRESCPVFNAWLGKLEDLPGKNRD